MFSPFSTRLCPLFNKMKTLWGNVPECMWAVIQIYSNPSRHRRQGFVTIEMKVSIHIKLYVSYPQPLFIYYYMAGEMITGGF